MRYNQDLCTVELSVRELCALAHQSGHLDASGSPRHRLEAMQEGTKRHRALQAAEPNYKAEVFVRNTMTYHGISYTVEGRADGVIEEEGAPEEVFGNPRSEKLRSFLSATAQA